MRLKLSAVLSILLAVFLVWSASPASAQGIYNSGSVGNDVSWPNCSAKPPTKAVFGIVGVTGGKPFSNSPCLANQAKWFTNTSLYANAAYPGSDYGKKYQNSPNVCADTDLNCLAYNYGYNAGKAAADYATSQGVSSATWWLDVETMNTWTSDINQNRFSINGQTDALKKGGASTIGIYSTTAQWQTITGGWQNGLPNWGATTWQTAKQASKYCTGHDFTGGGTWLLQFKGNLDQDVAC